MSAIESISPLADRERSGPSPYDLARTMREFRSRTLALVADLDERQMIGPRLSIVNPPLWEIGHIAWFQEFWVLRHLKRRRPLLEDGDRLYNSTDVAHDTRWELLLPTRQDTLRYMDNVLNHSVELIERAEQLSQEELYFYRLSLFHEGMHDEALAYTRQTLGYPEPCLDFPAPRAEGGPCPGDAEVAGGTFLLGATTDFPFVFDNEKWAHEVTVKPFKIARAPVTNGEFLGFVEDGGYRNPRWWSEPGRRWLKSGGAPELEGSFARFFDKSMRETAELDEFKQPLEHPAYWQHGAGGSWQQRVFDRFLPLRKDLPVVHVSWYEAEAYCNWAGRRLPTEAEWELAASGELDKASGPRRRRYYPWGDDPASYERANLDWRSGGPVAVGAYGNGDSAVGCRQMIGNVWEWTADDFKPYPGFIADPYKEYSQPWFGTHKVLRGGCWATSALLIRNTWRNFYTPDRRDVWAGFRSCAK